MIHRFNFSDGGYCDIDVDKVMTEKGKVESKRVLVEAGAIINKDGNIEWNAVETKNVTNNLMQVKSLSMPQKIMCVLYGLSEGQQITL